MILLHVDNITKRFGPEPVLDGVSFEVRPGDQIGLVGPNGTGKSTLMKIVARQCDSDSGTVRLHETARLGYLEQTPDFRDDETVWDIATEALSHLTQLVADAEQTAIAMAAATGDEQQRLSKKYDQLQQRLHKDDAYNLNHRIERILQGLGFQSSQFRQPVGELSGGQQNRLLLARLLLTAPELMLLDEPSNHLDIQATEWLENFLASSAQAFIVVSHDRYFLDRVTNRTLELFHGTVADYKGNFSAYWQQKDERLEVQKRTFEKQQEEIAKLKDFVRRHHHGQKHAQAKDRERKLERIVPVDLPREIAAPKFGFPAAARAGDIVLRVESIAKSFDQPLFQDLTFEIQRGERWGIIGGNGTGKTTLLRCIVGEVDIDVGRISLGSGVKLGYYDQQLASVDARLPAVEAIRPTGKEFVEQQRRDLLAKFGVTGDMAFQTVGSLSGGERSRVALARLAAENPNFVLFDEPTNHLDLWACDSLEKAIRAFDGTVLLVSHDRFFINRVVDYLLVVEHDRFRVIEGNYDTYLHLVCRGLAGNETPPSPSSTPKTPAKNPPKEKNTEKRKRKRKFPYRKLADIEADILDHETQIGEWHMQLTEPDVLREGEKVKEIQAQLEETQAALDLLYEHWEESSELN